VMPSFPKDRPLATHKRSRSTTPARAWQKHPTEGVWENGASGSRFAIGSI